MLVPFVGFLMFFCGYVSFVSVRSVCRFGVLVPFVGFMMYSADKFLLLVSCWFLLICFRSL